MALVIKSTIESHKHTGADYSGYCGTCITPPKPANTVVTRYIQKEVGSLEPEHRPKRLPLYLYLTARQAQYTKVTSNGLTGSTIKASCITNDGKVCVYDVPYQSVNDLFWGPPVALSDPPLPAWQNDLRSKIGNFSVNLAEYVGEYRESVKATTHLAHRVSEAWRQYRHWRRNPLKNWKVITPRDVAAVELTNRFVIKPLISDVEDSIVKLNAAAGRPVKRRVSSSSRDSKTTKVAGLLGGEFTYTSTRSVRATAYISVDTNMSTFTSGSPLEAIWAGIPYSFVVDWVLDVGGWLYGMSALRGIGLLGGTYTDKIIRKGADNRIKNANYSWVVIPATYKEERISRTVFTQIPGPVLRLNKDINDVSHSVKKLKTALELMASSTRR